MSAEEECIEIAFEDLPLLHQAVINGDEARVRQLIAEARYDKASLIHQKDKAGRTPLHYAAIYGQLRVAQYLVENGALINDRDENEHTSFYEAAVHGWADIVVYLAEVDASIVLKNDTLLQAAIDAGKAEVVAFLIQKGAKLKRGMNIGVSDAEGRTPLYFAERYRLSRAIRALRNAGAGVNAVEMLDVVSAEEQNQEKAPVSEMDFKEFIGQLDRIRAINLSGVKGTVKRILSSERNSTQRDGLLLLLCRQALWIDDRNFKKEYSFFDVAVESLELGSKKLKASEEYRYFRNMKALKGELGHPPLEVERNLYRQMLVFDDIVQKANFVPAEEEKAYQWANAEMERTSKPSSYNEEASKELLTELSSKGEMGEVKSYRLGRTAAWASIGLGVALIVASAVSVGGTLGMSFLPIFVPTLWLSYTLIGAGLAAIVSGATATNRTARPYKEAREVKEEWEYACRGVKAAFWPSPEPKGSRNSGMGVDDLIGGIGAVIGTLGI